MDPWEGSSLEPENVVVMWGKPLTSLTLCLHLETGIKMLTSQAGMKIK